MRGFDFYFGSWTGQNRQIKPYRFGWWFSSCLYWSLFEKTIWKNMFPKGVICSQWFLPFQEILKFVETIWKAMLIKYMYIIQYTDTYDLYNPHLANCLRITYSVGKKGFCFRSFGWVRSQNRSGKKPPTDYDVIWGRFGCKGWAIGVWSSVLADHVQQPGSVL